MIIAVGLILVMAVIIDEPEVHVAVRVVVGTATGVAGAILMVLATTRFRRAATTVDPVNPAKTEALVTSGVFGHTRNPMYVAMALWLVMVCMVAQSMVGLLVVPLFVLSLTRNQIRREEAALTKLFGEDYIEYQRTTPRWLLGS